MTITEFPIEGLKEPLAPRSRRVLALTITEFPIEGLKAISLQRCQPQAKLEVTITEFPIEGLKAVDTLCMYLNRQGDNYRIPD